MSSNTHREDRSRHDYRWVGLMATTTMSPQHTMIEPSTVQTLTFSWRTQTLAATIAR
jgi:hypothetical protein